MPSDGIVIIGALVVLVIVFGGVAICVCTTHREQTRIDRLIDGNRAPRRRGDREH